MSRRPKKTNLDVLIEAILELLLAAPSWAGPIVVAAAFAAFRWLVPLAFGLAATDSSKDPAQQIAKTMSQTFSAISFSFAPWAAFIVAMLWCFSLIRKLSDGKRLDRQTGIRSIRELDWREFEQLLAEAFRRQGYRVEHTGSSGGDGGIDIKLHRDGMLTVVQCKQWKVYKVGAPEVRGVLGAMADVKAQRGIVVTSGRFTAEATQLAERNPITLIAGPDLEKLIHSVQASPPSSAKPQPVATSHAPSCPTCGSTMIQRSRRSAQEDKFWGCSQFPKCRGTRQLT